MRIFLNVFVNYYSPQSKPKNYADIDNTLKMS